MEGANGNDAGQPAAGGRGSGPSGTSMASKARRGSARSGPSDQRLSETERQAPAVDIPKEESKASAASAPSTTFAAPSPDSGRKPSEKRSGSLSPRETTSLISRFESKMASAGSMLSGRRPRSAVSMPVTAPGTPRTVSRASLASRGSRGSRGTSQTADYGLSPGLQQLIARLVQSKDGGLIAYLSAIPGEPHSANKPPAAVNKLQQKGAVKLRSIMKISKPQVRFEPTYRLDPLRPFRGDRAQALVQQALEVGVAGATYSEQWATDASRILAAYITQCVKGLDTYAPCRYKIGTQVSVMERHSQGVRTELGVLWDPDRDRFIAASVETTTMVAFAVVYAVYWD